MKVLESAPHGPSQIAVSEILFDIEGVVVELHAERPVVPGGPCSSKQAVRSPRKNEHGIHRSANGTVPRSGMLGIVLQGYRRDETLEPGAVEDQRQPVACM